MDLLNSKPVKQSLGHHVLIKIDKSIQEGVFTTKDRTTVCFFSWKLSEAGENAIEGPPDTVRVLNVESTFRLYNHLRDLDNVISVMERWREQKLSLSFGMNELSTPNICTICYDRNIERTLECCHSYCH